MIKFEIIITAWEDGLHRGQRRIELEEYDMIDLNKIDKMLTELSDSVAGRKAKWAKIMEDDSIPF